MKTIAERQAALVEEFTALEDWEERYRRIIALGRELPELAQADKIERFRVRGCQSQVWLKAELSGETVRFRADSDAMIVRGLIALLLSVYSDARPEEILASPPDFIATIGLAQHLSATRANGLASMVEQMMYYAKAFHGLGIVRAGAAR